MNLAPFVPTQNELFDESPYQIRQTVRDTLRVRAGNRFLAWNTKHRSSSTACHTERSVRSHLHERRRTDPADLSAAQIVVGKSAKQSCLLHSPALLLLYRQLVPPQCAILYWHRTAVFGPAP